MKTWVKATIVIGLTLAAVSVIGIPDRMWNGLVSIWWVRLLAVLVFGVLILAAHKMRTAVIRNRAEQLDALNRKLRDSEKFHRMIVEDQSEMIMRAKPDGTILWVNDALCRFMGSAREELQGANVYAFLPEPDGSQNEQDILNMTPESPSVTNESHVQRADGEMVWLSWADRGVFDENGNLIEVQSTGRDVTSQRRAVDALRRSEEFLRDTGRAGKVGGWAFDAETGLTRWTEETYHIHEVSPDFEPSTDAISELIHPDDRALMREAGARALEPGEPFTLELRVITARGKNIWAQVIGEPVQRDGKVVRVTGTIQDITARKTAEQELRDVAVQLSTAEERERRSVATYLHDNIAQTLAVMRMRMGALPHAGDADDHERAVEEVCDLLDSVIEDTRTATFELSPPILYELGLGPAVEWVGEKISVEHGLAFDFEEQGRGAIEPDTVAQLFRGTRELMMNVVRHAQASRIAASVTSDPDDGIRIAVQDDGVGFDTKKPLSHIGGSGYGLLSIRERMRHVGGRMEIDSRANAGTRVSLIVPAPPEKPTNEVNEPAGHPRGHPYA